MAIRKPAGTTTPHSIRSVAEARISKSTRAHLNIDRQWLESVIAIKDTRRFEREWLCLVREQKFENKDVRTKQATLVIELATGGNDRRNVGRILSHWSLAKRGWARGPQGRSKAARCRKRTSRPSSALGSDAGVTGNEGPYGNSDADETEDEETFIDSGLPSSPWIPPRSSMPKPGAHSPTTPGHPTPVTVRTPAEYEPEIRELRMELHHAQHVATEAMQHADSLWDDLYLGKWKAQS